MPSRKRNKGKERKAKKEEAKRAWWIGWAIRDNVESAAGCKHGCVPFLPPRDHAVSIFMNTFYEASVNTIVTLKSTFEKDPEVWNDAGHRQTAIGILLSVGTNMILKGGAAVDMLARRIAIIALHLECYDGKGDFKSASHGTMMKGTAIASGNDRDTLKFYTKRISCSCLNERYKHARKTLPKMGKCSHCHEEKERSSLMTCGRCKVPFYCSRECQVANVPGHKEHCGVYVDMKKRLEVQATQKS